MQSELFGHVRGAFTGADRERPGAFVTAHGGTLLLDEVGDAPASLQVALLRALETRRIRAVGAEREKPVSVRVIAATSLPLAELMQEGTFRVDLFHRLGVGQLALPPLRERRCDIPGLARDLLRSLRPETELDPTAAALLSSADFPGNVRDLKNTLERALALAAPPPDGPYVLCPEDLTREAHSSELVTSLSPSSSPGPAVEAAVATVSSREPGELCLSPLQLRLTQNLQHLVLAAVAYGRSELLLYPRGLTRRRERAYERALLLILVHQACAEGTSPPAWIKRRFERLFRSGWELSDHGQALRDLEGLGEVFR